MPLALIEVRRHWSEQDEVAIIDAVHAALVAAFKIPVTDKHVRLIEHQPHRFATSLTHDQPEYATLVTIDCITGRSLAAKRQLYRGIVERLEALGIPRDHVLVLLRESDTDNWGVAGGQAASDVDLGFKLDV